MGIHQKPIKDKSIELVEILNKILVISNNDVNLKMWINDLKEKKNSNTKIYFK